VSGTRFRELEQKGRKYTIPDRTHEGAVRPVLWRLEHYSFAGFTSDKNQFIWVPIHAFLPLRAAAKCPGIA
jgi:hypothetical protein